MDQPAELSYAKCRDLLGSGVIGRVAVCTPDGPRIFPVNYSVVSEAVVFRTSPTGVVATHDWNAKVAFEVDHVDYEDEDAAACSHLYWRWNISEESIRLVDSPVIVMSRRNEVALDPGVQLSVGRPDPVHPDHIGKVF